MPLLTDRDVDQEISSDWAEIVARNQIEDEVAEIETPEPAKAEPAKAEPAEEPAKPAEARDEQGRFVKAQKVKEPKAAPVAKQVNAEPSKEDSGLAAAPSPERDVSRAPSTWRPAARAEWEKLSPALKAEIHKREADFMTGQSQLLPDAKLGSAIGKVMEPYRMMLQSEGATPEAAVAELMRTAAVFRVGTMQQKYQTIAQIARQFGLDLRVFGAPQPQAQAANAPQYRDPRVDQIVEHIQRAEQMRQARDRQVLEQEQQSTYSTADQWMNAQDAQGNPVHPYAADVIDEMTALIPQLKAANPNLSHADALQQAYERACWAHPEVRALLQAEQQQQSQEKLRSENQTRVREARRAASVNVPRRASTPAPPKPGRMEDTIAETARELGLLA
jgi:hypothetical protein